MIISHKYKFIFIKPTKVAGTSIEIALAKHCGKKDIITPITKYNPSSDSEKYKQPIKNYEELSFYNHIGPYDIKQKIGKEVWDNYYKFTVVRNPWDQAVSRFFWNKKGSKFPLKKNIITIIFSNLLNPKAYISVFTKLKVLVKKSLRLNKTEFDKFIMSFNKNWTNTKYYFDKKGEPICDFYIRYENLEKDYEKVCNKLGILYEKLPKTKDKQRKEKKHYSVYYNKKTKDKIESLFQKEIDFFNYKFKKN